MCDIDTAAKQTATEDNFLEIAAVYGTQTFSIKNEDETEIIIKEEGPAIDIDEKMYSDDNIIKIHQIKDLPLVYTTRLNEMNTFNNIRRYTSQEATEMIVEESKPHYEPLKKQPELSSDTCINSYIKLCSQIQQLNTKVKKETQLRNQILLDKCKPLQIVLEDFKTSNITLRPKTILDNKYSSDERSLYSSDDDEPIFNLIPKTSLLARTQAATTQATSSVLITVAVRDKRSQEADIYILDAKKGVKSYYRTNIKECNTLEKLHKSKKTVLIEYCCWVNRERRISRLIQLGFTRASLFYLRKPHNCLPRPCSCCCVFGNPILSKSNLILKNTELIDKNEVSVLLNDKNVINKAKNYIPNVPDLPITSNEPIDYLKWAVIIIKYHRTIFKQTNILGDNYEIGNGAIINFTRPTVNRSIPEEKQLYEKYDKKYPISRKQFSYLVCCWHNREDIIMRLDNISKLSPNVIKFMRTPHPCRSDKCICCCQPRPCTKLNLDKISTFQKSTKNQKKVPALKKVTEKRKTDTISNKSKPPKRFTLDKDADIQSVKIQKASNLNNSARTTNKTKPPEQGNNNFSINSRSEHNAIRTNSHKATNNKQNESIAVSEFVDLSSPDTARLTSPAKFIDSILDKFKGLILSVNERNQLTAIINAAPGTLSPKELKSISDILLLASSQIEQLGISPQEFCSRVNSSIPGNYTSPPMPALVPIKHKENKARTTLEYDTPDDSNVCKVQPLALNSCIPTTRNTSNVCSIYQVMSTLGGQKNNNLVRAYKLHFKDICPGDKTRQTKKQQMKEKSWKINKGDTQISTSEAFAVAKRKAPKNTDRNLKRLRVKAPQDLLLENPLQTPEQLWVGNNNVSHIPAVAGHNLAPLIVNNSNFLQLQNTVGMINPEAAQNQIPCFVTNNHLILGQKTSDNYVPQCEMRTISNQMPLFVINGNNFNPGQNTSGTNVPHNMGSFTGQVPYFVTNNNLISVPNTTGTHVVQPEIQKKKASTSAFLPADETNITIVPPSTIVNDKTPVDISNIIDITEESCGFDAHLTEGNNETPPSSKGDSLPMQNIINAVISNVATKPKGPLPSVNPLLYQILSQAQASPSLAPPIPKPIRSRRRKRDKKVVMHPSIQENTRKEPYNIHNKDKSTNQEKRKPAMDHQDDLDFDTDFESAISTTVIKNAQSSNLTKNDILDAVNNKQLIANDEEEGIFGV